MYLRIWLLVFTDEKVTNNAKNEEKTDIRGSVNCRVSMRNSDFTPAIKFHYKVPGPAPDPYLVRGLCNEKAFQSSLQEMLVA